MCKEPAENIGQSRKQQIQCASFKIMNENTEFCVTSTTTGFSNQCKMQGMTESGKQCERSLIGMHAVKVGWVQLVWQVSEVEG